MRLIVSFLSILCLSCFTCARRSGALTEKYAVFVSEDNEIHLVDCRDGNTRRILSICGIDAYLIGSVTLYDLYGIIQLTIGDSIKTIVLGENHSYTLPFQKHNAFQVLDRASILWTTRNDTFPLLLRMGHGFLSRTVMASRELNKSIYEPSAMCLRDSLIYYKADGIRIFNLTLDSAYTVIYPNAGEKFGNYVLVNDFIVINKVDSDKHVLSVYDIYSLNLAYSINMDASYQLNDQRYVTHVGGVPKILIRRADRPLSAGFGDYYLVDLADRSFKPISSLDKFRFGFFAGFIDERYLDVFQTDE